MRDYMRVPQIFKQMKTSKELKESKAQIWERAQGLVETAKTEKRELTEEQNTEYDGFITEMSELDKQIKFEKDENKQKWVHIDIAGPAFVESSWGYNPHGASGAGVRMAIEFIKSI